jgi:AcrR family transcriptional regulator
MASHLSATAYALFETSGYDATSMEQIAEKADVAKVTLYNYFPEKGALLAHRFREDIAVGMAERASALSAHKSFDSRMRYLLRESAAWHAQRRTYLPHYLRYLTSRARYGEPEPGTQRQESGNWELLVKLFRAAQASGDVTQAQSAEQIGWSFQYLLFAAVSAWLIDPSTNLTERFLAAFDLAMHGVALKPAKLTRAKTRDAR